MRCVECNKSGHLKCSTLKQSKKVKLTFHVADNLDEFLIAHDLQMSGYGEEETPKLSKRERKRLLKAERKMGKRNRRLSN